MKSILFTIFLTIFTALALIQPINRVSAAGDFKIATQSDTMYLTTTTTTTDTVTVIVTPTPYATASGTPIPLPPGSRPVFLPPGFFPSANALVNDLFRVIMVVSVILVFAYLVLGGFQYITSGGEKGKTEAARNKMMAAIVGLIIVASSYAILTVVLNFIGFRDVTGILRVGSIVSPAPTPFPTPTPTPTSALQQLLK